MYKNKETITIVAEWPPKFQQPLGECPFLVDGEEGQAEEKMTKVNSVSSSFKQCLYYKYASTWDSFTFNTVVPVKVFLCSTILPNWQLAPGDTWVLSSGHRRGRIGRGADALHPAASEWHPLLQGEYSPMPGHMCEVSVSSHPEWLSLCKFTQTAPSRPEHLSSVERLHLKIEFLNIFKQQVVFQVSWEAICDHNLLLKQ